ncbi:MAG: zinc ABC transporter substrate-binding protein [Erysipelothrix sp.]|nr:zinc ABC transporter substrate-binding protein [Erysipelothrix sp.]
MKKILFILTLIFVISACTPSRPLICVSVYPMEYLVKRLGGNQVDVCQLTQGEYMPLAQFNKDALPQIQEADLILYFGQLEPYFDIYRDDIFDSSADSLDILSLTPVLPFKRFDQVSVGGNRLWVESRYYESIAFDLVDMYQQDPYVWLDPINMLSIAKVIRNYLVINYPENEAVFNSNFTSLQNDLVLLDAQYQLLKNETNNIKFVSISPSFGHWQKAYNVEVYPVVLSRYGVLPNATQLNIIKETIIQNEVQYIALEPNLSEEHQALFNQLVEELELTIINLSNITSLTQADRDNNKDYLSLMLENLRLLESIGR